MPYPPPDDAEGWAEWWRRWREDSRDPALADGIYPERDRPERRVPNG